MNWLDVGIIVFLLAAVMRGLEIGFVRQLFSTVGFLGGLLLGALLQRLLGGLIENPESQAVLAVVTVLGCALLLMAAGEYLGLRLKFKMKDTPGVNRLDRIFGSVLAGVTVLAVVWLGATMFRNVPSDAWRQQINDSHVVTTLENMLPPAPNIMAGLGGLIDSNIFPRVFTGLEPELRPSAPLPDLGDLNQAVEMTRDSVVKLQGRGCGGIMEGSGFVAGNGLVITNAHVLAGVANPEVVDIDGSRPATVLWFDPELDLAIVRAAGLAGEPLSLQPERAPNDAPAVVLGYPEGAGFTVRPASINNSFTARGYDIYEQHEVTRHVYAVHADIRKGNSGGPLIDAEGSVIGVIFAQSVTHHNVGYALTMEQVLPALEQAAQRTDNVGTGRCAV